MRFWITSFLVLFGMAELFQWIRHFSVPLPMFILGGALLAIASNYKKLANWALRNKTAEPPLLDSANSSTWNSLNSSPSKPAFQPPRSISFTINRSAEPE
ncbi:MAG TPA: hypothetical protein V6D14_08970 [Coleofasciculaceae cyanobacterium]|jgi:hypothetical protein